MFSVYVDDQGCLQVLEKGTEENYSQYSRAWFSDGRMAVMIEEFWEAGGA